DALRAEGLSYFAPVARTPGFPRALARTIHELRLADVDPASLRTLPLGGPDLAALLERFDEQFAAARAIDRAALFGAAARALPAARPERPASSSRRPALLLLDVPIDSDVELAFVDAVLGNATTALVTVPFGDVATLHR